MSVVEVETLVEKACLHYLDAEEAIASLLSSKKIQMDRGRRSKLNCRTVGDSDPGRTDGQASTSREKVETKTTPQQMGKSSLSSLIWKERAGS